MKEIILSDKTIIPQVGLGTSGVIGKKKMFSVLDGAFESKYKLIDTAQYYNNEKEIGDYLKEKNIPRDKVYLTTKVWPSNFLKQQDFEKSVYQSLKRLQVKKVDLLLLHFATLEKQTIEVYKWLEKVKEQGLATSIGVSNFSVKRLKTVLKVAKYKPVINQMRFDLKTQQRTLISFCKENDIAMQGYSVLKPYLDNVLTSEEKKVIDNIALKHQKTWAQVILRWVIQEGFIVFPKSQNPKRIKSNIEVFDFSLDEEDMTLIRKMDNTPSEQWVDLTADGKLDKQWTNMFKKPLLFENHFNKEQNKLNGEVIEDLNDNNYR